MERAKEIEEMDNEEEQAEAYQELDMSYHNAKPQNVKFEVLSSLSEEGTGNLVFPGGHGFFASCVLAFAQHLPLRLSPDHLWAVIVNGFARHVNRHAEELRDNFVNHQGKKDIVIIFCGAELGEGTSSPDIWEDYVFSEFSAKIAENLNNDEAYETLTSSFSTTTPTRQAAVDVVLMAAMKHYFNYIMAGCGIPRIQLDGTLDDWIFLRDRTERLAQWMMPNSTHGDLWIYDIVLPILDEFVASYKGRVDYCFWQNMIKVRSKLIPGMCAPPDSTDLDSVQFLTGWLATLFPYLTGTEMDDDDVPNPYLRRWDQSASAATQGPNPEDIPTLISSAQVKWISCATNVSLMVHFHAGFRGVKQDTRDGTLEPVMKIVHHKQYHWMHIVCNWSLFTLECNVRKFCIFDVGILGCGSIYDDLGQTTKVRQHCKLESTLCDQETKTSGDQKMCC